MRAIPRAAVFVAFAASFCGAATQWSGPVMGVVYDQLSSSIRPILGLPGSAYLGASIATGIDKTEISPDGNSAAYIKKGHLYLAEDLQTASSTVSDTGVIGSVRDLLAWSGDATVLALYKPDGDAIQRFTHTHGQLTVSYTLDTKAFGEITTLLADATGAKLFFVAQQGRVTSAFMQNGNSSPVRLADVGSRGAVAAYGAASQSLYVSEPAGKAILRFSNVSESGAAIARFVGDGLEHVVALYESPGVLYVATTSTLELYDTKTGAHVSGQKLAFAPTSLQKMPGSPACVLKGRTKVSDPLWAVGLSATPRVFFIPGGSAE